MRAGRLDVGAGVGVGADRLAALGVGGADLLDLADDVQGVADPNGAASSATRAVGAGLAFAYDMARGTARP
jgi:hypothetical protein